MDEDLEDDKDVDENELNERIKEKEARANAQILEMVNIWSLSSVNQRVLEPLIDFIFFSYFQFDVPSTDIHACAGKDVAHLPQAFYLILVII